MDRRTARPGDQHLETNLTIQANRLNVTTKKVTGWAAIIAVPTLITGYFGMNVPYPGFGEKAGSAASIATIALTRLVLDLIFNARTGCKTETLREGGQPARDLGPRRAEPGPTILDVSPRDRRSALEFTEPPLRQ